MATGTALFIVHSFQPAMFRLPIGPGAVSFLSRDVSERTGELALQAD